LIVCLIRATTSEERGNLTMEHEGAYLGAFDQALAAHNNRGIVILSAPETRSAPRFFPECWTA
jgi:propionate CoA-transferase